MYRGVEGHRASLEEDSHYPNIGKKDLSSARYAKEFSKDPLHFMEKHIVIAPLDDPCNLSIDRIIYITIEEVEGATISNKKCGKVFNLVYVQKKVMRGDRCTKVVYWCPYKANDRRRAKLESKSDYCFTVRMSGCSFGMGQAKKNGAVYVAHANAATSGESYGARTLEELGGAMVQQSKVQHHFLFQKGCTDRVVSGKDYMFRIRQLNTHRRVTTFGKYDKDEKKWKLYYLQYTYRGLNEYSHGGIYCVDR